MLVEMHYKQFSSDEWQPKGIGKQLVVVSDLYYVFILIRMYAYMPCTCELIFTFQLFCVAIYNKCLLYILSKYTQSENNVK